jgi:proton-translocating NADH-quinone oxidoreductase chain N
MIEIVDVVMPIVCFVILSLLTIPAVKAIRRVESKKTILKICWFIIVFVPTTTAIGNLASKYYWQLPSEPFLNISLGDMPIMFSSSFLVDAVSMYMVIILLAVTAVTFLYGFFFINSEKSPSERYYAIMLMIAGCTIGAIFAGDFLTLFIFWEASAAGSSFLMLYDRTPRSLHATLKYLVMIVLASAFIIYGLSIVYSITGTLNFWAAKHVLLGLQDNHLLIIAFLFIASGYAIEAAIVPFHMWLPDAYTAAPASSSAFLSAIIDQGSYYILLRILVYVLTPSGVLPWTTVIAVLSALTMLVGNLLALTERNVKRLIADICIADVGYNLVAITSVTSLGIMGNLYFFLVGGVTTALCFMAVGILNKMGFETLDDFSGIGRKMPLTGFALLLGAFSFAGIPPLAGFLAKYMVFTSAIEGNMSWLALIGVLCSVIQTAYLLRLINYMYAKTPQDKTISREPKSLIVPIYVLVATIVVLGVFPTIVFNLIGPVIQQFAIIP